MKAGRYLVETVPEVAQLRDSQAPSPAPGQRRGVVVVCSRRSPELALDGGQVCEVCGLLRPVETNGCRNASVMEKEGRDVTWLAEL